MVQWIRAVIILYQDPRWIPNIHLAANRHLQLQAHSICHHLLAPVQTACKDIHAEKAPIHI